MVGLNTYRVDNPILDSRKWDNNNPIKFILTKKNKIEDKNFEIISTNRQLSVNEINDILFKKNIQSIIIEGGKNTLENFIKSNCWDEARLISSNKTLNGGLKAPKLDLKPSSSFYLKDDLVQVFFN